MSPAVNMNTLLLEHMEGRSLTREERLLYMECVVSAGWKVRFASIRHLKHRRTSAPRPGEMPIGSIDFVRAALHAARLPIPPVNHYPDALAPWMHRRSWMSSLSEVLASLLAGGGPVFIKPAHKLKEFTGTVVTDPSHVRGINCAPNFAVCCADPVTWLAEWRVYVVEGHVRSICHYAGDESLPADDREIRRAVAALRSADWPSRHFAVDFGRLSTGQTALVEMGCGYSMGAYDITAPDYLAMVSGWWRERLSAQA
jgi:hypothetical protein